MTDKEPETDDPADPPSSPDEPSLVMDGFRVIERSLLIVGALLTVGAAAIKLHIIYVAQTITLADILLMFLYTQVIAMIAVFYSRQGSLFVYPIFIAMTALARLIVLQGKDMAPENILFEAGSILLLAIAAYVIIRTDRS